MGAKQKQIAQRRRRSGIATTTRNPWAVIRLINWLSLLAVAVPLLANCAQQIKQSYVGQAGPADELAALAECRGEAANAPVPDAAPVDVRAEVAQGVMASCMAKRGFYLQ